MPPLVSVVLPTYNRASTLVRAMASVLQQTFTDFELVIVDDGSTDATPQILARYAGRENVKIITSRHRGCAAARNLGVKSSQGRYLAFQDSDDEWLPQKLATAMTTLVAADPETGVFYSDMVRVEKDGRVTHFKSPDVQFGVFINEITLDFETFHIGMQSAVIKRECLAAVGEFDEALPRFIDLDIFIRLADKFRFVHCLEPLVRYYAGEGISTNGSALVAARRYLIQKNYARLKSPRHHLAKQFLLLAMALDQNGQPYQSLGYVLKALATAPKNERIRREVCDALGKFLL